MHCRNEKYSPDSWTIPYGKHNSDTHINKKIILMPEFTSVPKIQGSSSSSSKNNDNNNNNNKKTITATATLIITVVVFLLPHYIQNSLFNFSLLYAGNNSRNLTSIALTSHENK